MVVWFRSKTEGDSDYSSVVNKDVEPVFQREELVGSRMSGVKRGDVQLQELRIRAWYHRLDFLDGLLGSSWVSASQTAGSY